MIVGWVTSNSPKDHRGAQEQAALLSSNQVPDQGHRISPQMPQGRGEHRASLLFCSRFGYLGETGSGVYTPKLWGGSTITTSHLHPSSPRAVSTGAYITQVLLISGTEMQSVKLEKTGYQSPALAMTQASFQTKPGQASSFLSHQHSVLEKN